MPEFVVAASELRTGKPYPLFIVVADDELAARRISQRRWLTIDGIMPYTDQPGEEKPPVLLWGPPASDRVFEQDYQNRPPDPDGSRGPSGEQMMKGGLLFLRVLFRMLGL